MFPSYLKASLFRLICFSILFKTSFGQDLTIEFGEVSGTKRGAEFLLSDANPNQKAIVAALLVEGGSLEDLRTNIAGKNVSPSMKILCAWHLAVCGAKSRLLQEKKSTNFSQYEVDLFTTTIENCGIEIPKNWRSFLANGEYLSNDWFDSLSKSAQMPRSACPKLQSDGHGAWFIETDRDHLVVPAIKEISDPILLAFRQIDGGAVVVLEDPGEAWGYYCGRLKDSSIDWLVRVEPYWVFPEGGGFDVDLTLSDNGNAVVFCVLPGSLSINSFSLENGSRTVSCSSKLGTLNEHTIRSRKD